MQQTHTFSSLLTTLQALQAASNGLHELLWLIWSQRYCSTRIAASVLYVCLKVPMHGHLQGCSVSAHCACNPHCSTSSNSCCKVPVLDCFLSDIRQAYKYSCLSLSHLPSSGSFEFHLTAALHPPPFHTCRSSTQQNRELCPAHMDGGMQPLVPSVVKAAVATTGLWVITSTAP